MKFVKAIGLAAVVATAAMAFVGVSSASASALCTGKDATVVSGKIICTNVATLLKLLGSATNPKLKVSASAFVQCPSVTVHALGHSEPGPSIRLSEVQFLWGGQCIQKGQPCNENVTVESPGKYSGEIKYADNAYSTPEEGESTVSIVNPETVLKLTNCFLVGNVTCKYATGTTVEGKGNNGAMTVSISQAIPSPGGICPAGTEEAVSSIEMGTPEGAEEGALGDLVLVAKE